MPPPAFFPYLSVSLHFQTTDWADPLVLQTRKPSPTKGTQVASWRQHQGKSPSSGALLLGLRGSFLFPLFHSPVAEIFLSFLVLLGADILP